MQGFGRSWLCIASRCNTMNSSSSQGPRVQPPVPLSLACIFCKPCHTERKASRDPNMGVPKRLTQRWGRLRPTLTAFLRRDWAVCQPIASVAALCAAMPREGERCAFGMGLTGRTGDAPVRAVKQAPICRPLLRNGPSAFDRGLVCHEAPQHTTSTTEPHCPKLRLNKTRRGRLRNSLATRLNAEAIQRSMALLRKGF